MMENDFPHTADELTKDWLASAVGATRGNVISELSLSRCGEMQGSSALIYRADVTWRGTGSLPGSLILKFASAKEQFRQYALTMGTYLKEVRFYQTLGASGLLPVPQVFFSGINEQSGHFLIVMEDLTDARMSKWFADGVEDVQLALISLAQIHARYWNDTSLDELPWLGRADDISQSAQYRELLARLLPPAKKKFASLLSDYAWAGEPLMHVV